MNILIFKVLQIVLVIMLTALVTIQTKSGGLSSSVSGSINLYRSKRGIERGILIMTIISIILLVVNSLIIVSFS